MRIEVVYDFTVSGIDGNGQQYMCGMLEPERLDSHGLRIGKAFHIELYHKQQKSVLSRFNWVGGVPHNWEVLAIFKDEIITEVEVEALLRKYKLIEE